VAKKEKIDHETAVERNQLSQPSNPFLARPVNPEEAIKIFLIQARNSALRHSSPKDCFEIEGRLGILKTPSGGFVDARVLSSGPKRVPVQGKPVVATAFLCSTHDTMDHNKDDGNLRQRCNFEAGTSRSHYLQWTLGGLSEVSPISTAFGIRIEQGTSESATIKRDLLESEKMETIYTGYSGHGRVCFPGDHTTTCRSPVPRPHGRMESKIKVQCTDIALPSAPYDLRLTLSTEEVHDSQVQDPPTGYTQIRLKKRRTYTRRDNSFAWILDVTEVTTSHHEQYTEKPKSIEYEIEFELNSTTTSKLLSESEESKVHSLCNDLSKQLWWMIGQINPNTDILNVDDFLREHPNTAAVRTALAQCHSIKQFVDTKQWSSAIAISSNPPPNVSSSSHKTNFPGCMPGM
jgi:hypothetical protein